MITIKPENMDKNNPWKIECPMCGAKAGRQCLESSGGIIVPNKALHIARRAAAKAAKVADMKVDDMDEYYSGLLWTPPGL